MIEVQVPPRATEAALRPFLDVLRGKYEAGAVYVVQGELRPRRRAYLAGYRRAINCAKVGG